MLKSIKIISCCLLMASQYSVANIPSKAAKRLVQSLNLGVAITNAEATTIGNSLAANSAIPNKSGANRQKAIDFINNHPIVTAKRAAAEAEAVYDSTLAGAASLFRTDSNDSTGSAVAAASGAGAAAASGAGGQLPSPTGTRASTGGADGLSAEEAVAEAEAEADARRAEEADARRKTAAGAASGAAASGAATGILITDDIAATKAQADQVQTGTDVKLGGIDFKVRARIVSISKKNYTIQRILSAGNLDKPKKSIKISDLPSGFPSLKRGQDLLLTEFNNHNTYGSKGTRIKTTHPYNIRVVRE
tara:strand:+ start:1514 stop:2428 length:915 start_codon:yes stop_codon:yes gene_type:complete